MNEENPPPGKGIKLPLFLGLALLAVVAVAWLLEPSSREELLGATGKIRDLASIPSAGWCPNYMLGTSSLPYDAFALAQFLSACALQLFGAILGPVGAEKLLMLASIPAAAASMWFFARKLGCDSATSAWISLLYVALPPFHVAAGIYEHRIVIPCFVFAPWILRGILAIAQRQAPREIVLLGLAAAALALSYTKIAVAISPMLLAWTLGVLWQNRPRLRSALIGYVWSALVAALAGAVFLLPAAREYGFSAGFQLDPLEGWKLHYSFKTPLLWIDLWGFLTKGGSPGLRDDAAMFWIGAVPLLALSLALGLPRLAEWRTTPLGRSFLLLTGCWLVSIWFASGPGGLLGNQILVLKYEQGLNDHSIAFAWLSFAWMGWLIYRTMAQLLTRPAWLPGILTLLALTVPVFRLVELFPLFKDIRAPESFWKIGGFCCLAAAVGLSLRILFTRVVAAEKRRPVAIAVGVLMLVELYPVHSAYWTQGLDRQLFAEFDEAAAFLKTAPVPGRVHTLGTRYFYLTLPQKAARALDNEALHRHFQLEWVRHLEVAGDATPEAQRSYMNLAGVAYILIDKEDPRTSKQTQDYYRSVFPVVFENRYFAVLENAQALYPAFLAKDFVPVPPQNYAMATTTLGLLPLNIITVEMAAFDPGMPGIAGSPQGPALIDLQTKYKNTRGEPFVRMPLVGHRMDDSQRMRYQLPPSGTGWLVVSEAYHPDWTAKIDGSPAEVRRSEIALLSVFVPPGSKEVVFEFQPPAWYSLCRNLGALAWAVALAALVFLSCPLAPTKWRNWWVGGRA